MPEIFNQGFSKVKQSGAAVSGEFREKISGFIGGGLGLVAGLAWNDAISSLIKYLFPAEQGGGIVAKFVYALIITIFVVLVMVYLVRFIGGDKKQ